MLRETNAVRTWDMRSTDIAILGIDTDATRKCHFFISVDILWVRGLCYGVALKKIKSK